MRYEIKEKEGDNGMSYCKLEQWGTLYCDSIDTLNLFYYIKQENCLKTNDIFRYTYLNIQPVFRYI